MGGSLTSKLSTVALAAANPAQAGSPPPPPCSRLDKLSKRGGRSLLPRLSCVEQSASKYWIGLDLGLRRTCVCIVDGAGAPVHQQECDSSLVALEQALGNVPQDRIEMISVESGSDFHIVRKLRSAGYPVTIFEAHKASKFLAIRRNKTDANDARGLADLARVGRHAVSHVYLKSRECQEIRGLLTLRSRVLRMNLAATATVRARFATYGRPFKPKRSRGGLRSEVEAQAACMYEEDGIDLRGDLLPLVNICETVAAYLTVLDNDVARRARSNPVCRLLMDVPGVGPVCALSFYSAIADPSRFKTSSDVGAYLGLIPRRRQSGSLSQTLGITKAGSRMTRSHLVTSAMVFASCAPDCDLKRWHKALRERAGTKRARVALARKLAVLLLAMWKTGARFDPGLGPRQASVAETIVANSPSSPA